MNGFVLAWKNIIAKPLRSGFNLILIAITIALICLGVLVNNQFENHFQKNMGPADLILSAKGSPLQSILCNLFFIDLPTGNISTKETRAFCNPSHPIIKTAIPVALGDQYSGFRIAGTSLEYFSAYDLELSEGKIFENDFQAVIGSEVAKKSGLRLGDQFYSSHGFETDTEFKQDHNHRAFSVFGILKEGSGVADHIILCTVSSYWRLHEHEEDSSSSSQKPILKTSDLIDQDNEITSLLLEFKGTNVQTLNFGRSINENTGMMASYPVIELNRLYELSSGASDFFSSIGILFAVMAFLGLFISLWQAMEERIYEMALLRMGGASQNKIFSWTIIESVLLSAIGSVFGIAIAHIALWIAEDLLLLNIKYGISAKHFFIEELYIFIAACILGILSGVIPSFKASKIDIHYILSKNS